MNLIQKIKHFICSSKLEEKYMEADNKLTDFQNRALGLDNRIYALESDKAKLESQIQEHLKEIENLTSDNLYLNQIISKPTSWQERLVVTNHAVERYKERVENKGTDLYLMLKSKFIKYNCNLDSIPDGTYEIERNVTCRIKDNTMTTITFRRGANVKKLQHGKSRKQFRQ
jgi:predicted  nucleic acid-binding Zn-ribbon protein